jgi:hypothetical protein
LALHWSGLDHIGAELRKAMLLNTGGGEEKPDKNVQGLRL